MGVAISVLPFRVFIVWKKSEKLARDLFFISENQRFL